MSKNNQKEKVPANVIFLGRSIFESKEEIISGYIDLLKSCSTAQEFHALFDGFYEDIVEKTAIWILERQIQENVEIIESLRKPK